MDSILSSAAGREASELPENHKASEASEAKAIEDVDSKRTGGIERMGDETRKKKAVSYAPACSTTLETCTADHSPPRAVGMPR